MFHPLSVSFLLRTDEIMKEKKKYKKERGSEEVASQMIRARENRKRETSSQAD